MSRWVSPKLLGFGEDLVGDAGGGEWCSVLGAGLAGESDVLVHQPDVEPRLVGRVEHGAARAA